MRHFGFKARRTVLYAFPVAIASSALAVSFVPQIAHASTPNLTPVSPTTLLGWIKAGQPVPLSGTVRGVTSFPIPSFSGLQSSNPMSLVGGSSSVSYNIWDNAAGSFRAQQLQGANEKDLYVTPGAVWMWDSSTLTATRESLPSGHQASSQSQVNPSASASEIVSKLSNVSNLSVSGTSMVAGRPAYTLSVTPLVSDSLIGSIRISVDGQTHIVDQVQIFPKGSDTPAASLGFDTLSFSKPQSSIFNFVPPQSSKVTSGTLGGSTLYSANGSQVKKSSGGTTHVNGSGFDSVVISSGTTKLTSSLAALVKTLPVVSTHAGLAHLYSTPIFQAFILPNGTVVAGAVDTARLLAVANSL